MSRLAKREITIPAAIKAEIQDGKIIIKGPKGELSHSFSSSINIEIKEDKIRIKGDFGRKTVKQQAGLNFALINNMIRGVTEGYSRELEIVGVGYKAQLAGENLNLQLRFSHPVVFPIPKGINIQVPKTTQIVVQGIDKGMVGDVSAQIRAILPPEPYKGTGIRYKGEYVRKKIGKAVTK